MTKQSSEKSEVSSMDHNLSLIKALVNTLHIEVETLEENVEGPIGETVDLTEKVREYEAKLIKAALVKTGGNQRRAAEILRLKPTTLNAKIKQHNIRVFRENLSEDPGKKLKAAA